MSDHLPDALAKLACKLRGLRLRWRRAAIASAAIVSVALGAGFFAYDHRGDDTDRLLRKVGYVGPSGITDSRWFEAPQIPHPECGTPLFEGPATDSEAFSPRGGVSYSDRLLPRLLAGYRRDENEQVIGDARPIVRRLIAALGMPRYAFSGNNLGCHTGLVLIYGDHEIAAPKKGSRAVNSVDSVSCEHASLLLQISTPSTGKDRNLVSLTDNWKACRASAPALRPRAS
jgi:hypothetical protein